LASCPTRATEEADDRVRRALEHYEAQSDEERAQDEAAYEATGYTTMGVPVGWVPGHTGLIASGAAMRRPCLSRRIPSRFNGPRLAPLAPAAERARYAYGARVGDNLLVLAADR
jgi:hypothetical protein